MENKNNNLGFEPIKVEVEEYTKFPSTSEIAIMNSTTLGQEINKFFKPIFKDYYGCLININPINNSLYASLFFMPVDVPEKDSIYAYYRMGTNAQGNSDIIQRYKESNKMSSNRRTYLMTDQAKDYLAPFICDYKINRNTNKNTRLYKNIKWQEIESEIYENQQQNQYYGYQSPVIIKGKVEYVSIEKLCAKCFYGPKTESGSKIYYQSNLVRVNPTLNGQSSSLTLTISNLDSEMLERAAKDVGMVVTPGLPIIKA